MATNPTTQVEVRWALHDKRVALARYIQELYRKESDDPDLARIEIGRARIELELTFSILSEMASGQPIMLPDQATIESLRNSVAILSQAIASSQSVNQLIAAADEVIKVWPD